MPWNSVWPDGSVSVKANNTPGQQNTTYTEDTLNKDHYWNIGSNEDGRHQFVNMPNQASEPSIATGMDGLLYAFENVSSQPFFKNSNSVMQMLGIRAMAVFNSAGTLAYSYNVASVTNTATGRFTVTYTTALPNNNYLVIGGSIRNDSDATKESLFEVQGATSLNTVKSTALVKVMTKSDGGSFHAPLQAWVVCFGG